MCGEKAVSVVRTIPFPESFPLSFSGGPEPYDILHFGLCDFCSRLPAETLERTIRLIQQGHPSVAEIEGADIGHPYDAAQLRFYAAHSHKNGASFVGVRDE